MPVMVVVPELANEYGLHEALVLRQLHYWLGRATCQHEGLPWVYKSFTEWNEEFTWWKRSTIHRLMTKLADDKLISIRIEGGRSYYTINYQELTVECQDALCGLFENRTEEPQVVPKEVEAPFENRTEEAPKDDLPFENRTGAFENRTAHIKEVTEITTEITGKGSIEGEGASAQTPPTPFSLPPDDAEPEPEPEGDVNFWEDGPAGNPLGARPPDPGQAMHIVLCEALGWDFNILPRKRRTDVIDASETLKRGGYSVEDVRRFMPAVWFLDWRWKNNQSRPTLDQLMEEIPKLRLSTPEPVARASPKLSEDERGRLITRARNAMASLKTAQKFKGKIDPEWQRDIDRARELNLI